MVVADAGLLENPPRSGDHAGRAGAASSAADPLPSWPLAGRPPQWEALGRAGTRRDLRRGPDRPITPSWSWSPPSAIAGDHQRRGSCLVLMNQRENRRPAAG